MFPLAILAVFLGAAAMPLMVTMRVNAAEERAEHWTVVGVGTRHERSAPKAWLPYIEVPAEPCVGAWPARPHAAVGGVEPRIAADTPRRDFSTVPGCASVQLRLEDHVEPTPRARPTRPRPVRR